MYICMHSYTVVQANPLIPFADIVDVINRHIGILTDTISLDLTYFSSKFIESGFITHTVATDILTELGVSDRDKASQLLDRVTTNYEIAQQKQEWVDKFVAVFSSQPAYEDLALIFIEETDPPGIVLQTYCTLYFIQVWSWCIVWIIIAILQQALHYVGYYRNL